jgi:uncharacterized repeat protein (TIGR03803 family)
MKKNNLNAAIVLSLFTILCSPIVSAQDFWGMTANGGPEGNGSIFKTDTGGTNLRLIYSFPCTGNPGGGPGGDLLQASDGNLYGLTSSDQAASMGVLFKYVPGTGTYTRLVSFLGISNGANPYGSLIQAVNGKLYGLTSAGGTFNAGTLFEFDPLSQTLTKKYDFDGAANGLSPFGSLIQAANGKLYGLTYGGGVNSAGIIFEYDLAGAGFTKKHDFDGASQGGSPNGSLVQAAHKLYGMTKLGGVNSAGVIFVYDPATSGFTKKADLSASSTPYGSLLNGMNGKLYGLTYGGGGNSVGAIIQYDTVSAVVKDIFDFAGGAGGANPYGSLSTATNGKLYGMTTSGGVTSNGIIFEFDTVSKIFINKFNLNGTYTGPGLGSAPEGSLIQASNGKLYGLTISGGVTNSGVLFEYDLSGGGTYTDKVDFNMAANGASPLGTLVRASNGKLYGMTSVGGINGMGVLFEYDTVTSTFTKKIDFDGSAKGFAPQGSLMRTSSGKLFGMTLLGGVNNQGVLFEYDPATSTYTKRLDFGGGSVDAAQPYGALIQATDGKLYGLTAMGGGSGAGVIFQYDTLTHSYAKKYDFDGALHGSGPYGSLVQCSTGKLYGLTSGGGVNTAGILFSYDLPTSTFLKQFDFDGPANGASPNGSLAEGANGKLYGMTSAGGANGNGVIFEFDTATFIFTNDADLNNLLTGNSAQGSFIKAPNSKLYGMTSFGGANTDGAFLEYNTATGNVKKELDFSSLTSGQHPYGDLLFLCNPVVISGQPAAAAICPGQPVTFTVAGTGTRISFQWYKNGTVISGATGTSYTIAAVVAGDVASYTCSVMNGCSNSTSSGAALSLNPAPAVSFNRPSGLDTLCSNGAPVALSGGSPTSGTYSGAGVTGGNIDPSMASLGNNTITYSFTNGSGCTGTAQTQIYVKSCAPTGIVTPQMPLALGVYPNPCDGTLHVTIEGGVSSLEIYNSFGQIVYKNMEYVGTTVLELGNLPNGVYLLKEKGPAGYTIQRFVMQR